MYRPEEHIDNPKDYADNVDARKYDQRLRPPVQPIELEIDPQTGMKNYIANENLGIATSAGYIRHSFTRSIHFGRLYTSGAGNTKGREADLCEALRCLGQGLHCIEDFGAHTNYTELALRELGHRNVFTHSGAATEVNVRGHHVFPLVTGTFGVVDFLHSGKLLFLFFCLPLSTSCLLCCRVSVLNFGLLVIFNCRSGSKSMWKLRSSP